MTKKIQSLLSTSPESHCVRLNRDGALGYTLENCNKVYYNIGLVLLPGTISIELAPGAPIVPSRSNILIIFQKASTFTKILSGKIVLDALK